MWVRSLGGKDPLEEEMATPLRYSCLEKIPWTEEPGGLQSMGPHRVRHDWACWIWTVMSRGLSPVIPTQQPEF